MHTNTWCRFHPMVSTKKSLTCKPLYFHRGGGCLIGASLYVLNQLTTTLLPRIFLLRRRRTTRFATSSSGYETTKVREPRVVSPEEGEGTNNVVGLYVAVDSERRGLQRYWLRIVEEVWWRRRRSPTPLLSDMTA